LCNFAHGGRHACALAQRPCQSTLEGALAGACQQLEGRALAHTRRPGHRRAADTSAHHHDRATPSVVPDHDRESRWHAAPTTVPQQTPQTLVRRQRRRRLDAGQHLRGAHPTAPRIDSARQSQTGRRATQQTAARAATLGCHGSPCTHRPRSIVLSGAGARPRPTRQTRAPHALSAVARGPAAPDRTPPSRL